MRLLTIIQRRLRSLLRKGRQESDLDEELRFHIERQIAQNLARGMSLEQARRAALREFGGVAQIQEQCRDQRGVSFLETLFRDAAYALRVLRKSPGFTAVAVLSLALGIGANTAIFSLINAVLLKSLPVESPEQLMQLDRANLEHDGMTSFSYPFYREVRDGNQVFSDLICVSGSSSGLRLDGGIEKLWGELVSGNFFQALGVQPFLGRLLSPEDDNAAAPPVVVLSYGFWQRRFGGDPSLVGKTITLRDVPTTVIGVASPSFHGLDKGSLPAYWAPITKKELVTGATYLEERNMWWLQIVGRLKPGVSEERARAALDPFLLGLASTDEPTTDHARRVRRSERMVLQPIGKGMSGMDEKYSGPLLVLMAAVCVVLLITCVNIANLLIARGAGRQREIAVRLAIGAGRRRIARQLLTESFLLAGTGALAGVAASYWMVQVMVSYLSSSSNPLDVTPDLRVLGFTVLVSALSGFLFGLAPAIQSSRPDLAQALKVDSPLVRGRATWRKCAVSLQIALALPLLVTAGLFLRTLYNLYTQDMGFAREDIVQVSLYSSNSDFTAEQNRNYLRDVVDRVTALPGIRGASFAAMGVLRGQMWGSGITVEGVTVPEGEPEPLRNVVGPDFFRTMGTPILVGREFDWRDDENSSKVAIVNESFAKHYYGSENPLGRKIGPGGRGAVADTEIIGVAKDTRYARVREETPRFWYMPYEQVDWKAADLTLHVRTAVDPDSIIPALRDAVQAVDSNIAVDRVNTLESLIEDHLTTERLVAILSSFFGLLAALLASVGLYGVMAYTTARRRQEIGVRLALGAEPARVRRLVLRGAVAQAVVGIAVGVPAALASTRLIESQLFGVESADLWTITGATALLAVVALIAGYLPARRASQVNPAIVLRCDG